MAQPGTVLVIGGSSGIGLAMAREYAAKGHALVLVARNEAKLASAVESLASSYRVPVRGLVLDAAAPGGPARVAEALGPADGSLRHAVIGLGLWHAGPVASTETAALRAALEANVVAQHALLRVLLPRLAPGGGLLFVGSLAGTLPLPWLSPYAASKACLHASVLALRQELAGSGHKVCLLAPGVVMTGFVPRSQDSRWRWLIELLASRPETVARAACRGLEADAAVIVPGLLWRLIWLGMRLVPSPILARLTRLLLRPLAPAVPSAHAPGSSSP
jgi:hypothetical protein